jgi:hypothetical protein
MRSSIGLSAPGRVRVPVLLVQSYHSDDVEKKQILVEKSRVLDVLSSIVHPCLHQCSGVNAKEAITVDHSG